MELDIPSVFDMDIGNDPDDTCVAVMLALDPKRYNPLLIITNDEAQSKGRVRFLAEVVKQSGGELIVASGLPSCEKRKDTLVERAGLIPMNKADFIDNGISYLSELLSINKKVNYFGLGALTNLATVLAQHPEFADKINLIQMGPSFRGLYRKQAPQSNVRLDINSFKEVLSIVNNPTLLMSHSSWGNYAGKEGRQQIGIYTDDPLYDALANSKNNGMKLFAEHLKVWKEDGKPCSIMHDPLTVLSFYEKGIVDYTEGEIVFDNQGFTDLKEESKKGLSLLEPRRLMKLSGYINNQALTRNGMVKKVNFSLNTDYDLARKAIIQALFKDSYLELTSAWKDYNSTHKDIN